MSKVRTNTGGDVVERSNVWKWWWLLATIVLSRWEIKILSNIPTRIWIGFHTSSKTISLAWVITRKYLKRVFKKLFVAALESVSQYLQCTPPPAPVFDPHPKACNNTFDCFPNLCCAEAGKKHCRPPKRSILSLLTGFAQGFSNISFIRDWTENLVIK